MIHDTITNKKQNVDATTMTFDNMNLPQQRMMHNVPPPQEGISKLLATFDEYEIVILRNSTETGFGPLTNIGKKPKITFRLKCEEDYKPIDGYNWRKYGQKVVKKNPNPRSYYRCTFIGCNAKKHLERAADDLNMLLTTYKGIHIHKPPPSRTLYSPPNQINQTGWLGRPTPSSSLFNNNSTDMRLPPMAQQFDINHYMNGLSNLPTLPANQNWEFMQRDQWIINQ